MVQALINNMNIESSSKFSAAENRGCTNPQKDFSDILKIQEDNTVDTTNTNNLNGTLCETKENPVTVMTIGMMKEAALIYKEDIRNIIDNVINENGIEKALDLTLMREENANVYEMAIDTEAKEIITENSEIIEENNSEETITTNEENPIMNNTELTMPPENQVLALTWHTQVHPSNQNDENLIDEFSENPKIELSIKVDNTKSEADFKNLMPEDDTQQENITLEETAEDDEVVIKNESTKLSEMISEEVVEDLNIESVQSEMGGKKDGSSDFMFYQPPQEQSIKGLLFGNAKYEPIQTSVEPQNATLGSKILEQITKQMESMYNGSKVEIVLNPENLGKVALHIMNTKEGLTAQFTVTTQDVRNMLMKGLGNLKDNLLAHGVNVDNVSVKLNETTESEYNFDWTEGENSGNGNKQQNPQKQNRDEKQFEQMMFEIENDGKV